MISVNREFRVHKLNSLGMDRTEHLAEIFDNLLSQVLDTVSTSRAIPALSGREIALVRTHLELASFYAKKAMAQVPENQIEEAS